MRELAIEGVDGVGKTTAIGELVTALEDEGQTVRVAAPYRAVTDKFPHVDTYAALHDPSTAQDVLQAVAYEIGLAQKQAFDEHADVLIFDRHWMTATTEVQRDGAHMGVWIAGKPKTALFDPDIKLTPELFDRLINPDEPWANDKDIVEDYIERYRRLAWMYRTVMLGVYRVDAHTTPQKIARAIRWDLRVER